MQMLWHAAQRTWGWARGTWWVGPACWVLVAVLDGALLRSTSYTMTGVLDEPAHTMTTLICLLALAAAAGRELAMSFVLPALVMGNLIDLDHLPLVLGDDVITAGTARPYSHSLAMVALLSLCALVLWLRRRPAAAVLAGAAFGVSCHLFRDLGTAPVALYWPFTDHGVQYPESLYLVLLAALTGLAVQGARTVRRAPSPAVPRTGDRVSR